MASKIHVVPPLPENQPFESDQPVEMQEDSGAGGGTLTPIASPLTRQPFPGFFNSLRGGCWLLNYQPNGSPLTAYDGTLRVEVHSGGRTASGDLYQRPIVFIPLPQPPRPVPPRTRPGPDPGPWTPGPGPVIGPTGLVAGVPGLLSGQDSSRRIPFLTPGPSPANGIPILARDRYRYYVRVTSLPETIFVGKSFNLSFELWRFNSSAAPGQVWSFESAMTARMVHVANTPPGYPSPSDYYEGDVTSTGKVVGRLTMGWLTKYYRRATIEIDTVKGCEQPLNDGGAHDWSSVMEDLGWQVNVELSDQNVREPSGNSWSDAEMHSAMLQYRQTTTNLDAEWRYHILAVRNIDSTPRGIMFDAGATDSNHVPREGVGIATDWKVEPGWGSASGKRFGSLPAPYFRTAVHELGHAMGQYHNFADHGFMCTSDVIASSGSSSNPFPNNIQWSYNSDNLKQLRHYPDPFVRPGGVSFGDASPTAPPITPTDLEVAVPEIELKVTPLLGEVPLGAPVRVDYTLTNIGSDPIAVPSKLTLKSDFVTGTVTDPSGAVRSFHTLVRCEDEHRFEVLAPGQSKSSSATLLRGRQGALFGMAGLHTIEVNIQWEVGAVKARLSGQTTVLITPVLDAEHAAAAHAVLTTPDVHLVLALGGDHLTEGIGAIQTALGSKVLKPHFAVVEAKRVGRRFFQRPASAKAATDALGRDAVMSSEERIKLAKLTGLQADAIASHSRHSTGREAKRRTPDA